MRKIINYFIFGFIALLMANPTIVFAKAIFNITPNVLSVSVNNTGSSSVTYTVTNDTNHTINQISVEPSYQTNGTPNSIILQNDNCSPTTLQPNVSCTFQVLLLGQNQPSSFRLRPRVCGYNGLECSVSLGSNELQVTVSTPSSGAPTVTSSNPASSSVSPTTSQIVFNFSEAMEASTINNTTVQVTQNGSDTNIISTCTASNSNTSFSCAFNTNLGINELYNVIVTTGATSASGIPLAQSYTTTFSTYALIAGDGSSNTYYVNASNDVFVSSSGGSFTAVSYSSGSPSGNITLLAGDGNGHMYFATSTGEIWQNTSGGSFSQNTPSFTGSIVALTGDGTYGNMYFATSTGQFWANSNAGTFTQPTLTGTPTGSITQISGDGVGYVCFLTSTSQVWCGFYGADFSSITYSGGSLSGNIIRLVGIVNANSPIHICFYTSNNQLWEQTSPGDTGFQLITFSGTQPTGIIQQMASDGNGNLYFITTTNEVWGSPPSYFTYSPVTVNGSILGTANGLEGNNGYTYFSTTSGQLWESSGSSFSPLTVGFSGNISQFSGSGGYMYFVTLNDQIWKNLNGSTFTQLTTP